MWRQCRRLKFCLPRGLLGDARDGALAICAVALVPVERYFRVEPCGECHERCPFALLFRIKKVGLFGIDRRIVADAHQLSAEQFALDEDARQQSEPETRYGRVNRHDEIIEEMIAALMRDARLLDRFAP